MYTYLLADAVNGLWEEYIIFAEIDDLASATIVKVDDSRGSDEVLGNGIISSEI